MSEIRVDSITDEAGTGAPEITDHYKKSNILGTVSESSGVPTGAIIERGSNANGEFVKYADGTMIVRGITEDSGDTNLGNQGGFFYSTGKGFTFPSSFIQTPAIQAFNNRSAGPTGGLIFIAIGSGASPTLTGVNLQAVAGESTRNAQMSYTAIGRWY